MDNSFLSQEEIDALLKQNNDDNGNEANTSSGDSQDEVALTPDEQDALGEIGNISMGSASTALSDILGKKVMIDTPRVKITTPAELYKNFKVPYILIEVTYTTGIEGKNLLVIKVNDAAIIADLMMGGTGNVEDDELDEIKVSAVSEAMNQMIGSAATSLSTIFNKKIEISPPTVTSMNIQEEEAFPFWDEDQKIVVTSFNLQIEELLKSEIMQIMPVEVAKQEVDYLMSPPQEEDKVSEEETETESDFVAEEEEARIEVRAQAAEEKGKDNVLYNDEYSSRNLDLILDVPLKVSVLLGKTKRPINEILELSPGSIVELERLADEPVDILVNGTLIAKGEVVVVNENFGVKITQIIAPEDRIKNLGKN